MTASLAPSRAPLATVPPIVSPEDVARMGLSVRLLDVRTPAEFETVHLTGSYNVPLDTLPEHAKEIRSAAGRPIVLVCQSGTRAAKAAELLKAAGLQTVGVMEGGVNRWLVEGRPATKGAPRMSLERQVRIAAGALAAIGGLLALFVDARFAAIPAFVGSGLVFAGITDTCMMGMMMAKAPWNRPTSYDATTIVKTLLREG